LQVPPLTDADVNGATSTFSMQLSADGTTMSWELEVRALQGMGRAGQGPGTL